jgi:acyl-CoA thioesterase
MNSRSPWDDLSLEPDTSSELRFRAVISEPWMLAMVPQGGIVAALAAQAMANVLAQTDQTLRTITVVFAGKVAAGPVEIEVSVLRKGRSISQLSATVRNEGSESGLTAIAAFGAPRRGFDFTELEMPDVEPPAGIRGFRDPLPDGVEFEFDQPLMPFWDSIVDSRPVIGRAPWDPFEEGPAESACWLRLDQPPLLAKGQLDPLALLVLCDTMPGAVGQKVGPGSGSWFGPSVDLTVHLLAGAEPGWVLAHNRARYAGDGYASVEQILWSQQGKLLAYGTQLMFFAFYD